jgi:hypothetical protein
MQDANETLGWAAQTKRLVWGGLMVFAVWSVFYSVAARNWPALALAIVAISVMTVGATMNAMNRAADRMHEPRWEREVSEPVADSRCAEWPSCGDGSAPCPRCAERFGRDAKAS